MRRIALHLDASPGFVGPVRPMFGVICLCWSWTASWGCFGWGGRPGQDLPASFRVLFEELEGVG